MTARHRNKNTAGLSDRILAVLQRETIQSTDEIGLELGFSPATINTRIKRLAADNLVHFIVVRTNGNVGRRQLWIYGPVTATPYQLDASQLARYSVGEEVAYADLPRQKVSSRYQIHNFRCEFETLFHGSARREVA